MDDHTTYKDDFYGWSQEQAAVLRRLQGRRDLPNDLDLEHVIEEIEGVGGIKEDIDLDGLLTRAKDTLGRAS